MKKFKKWIKTPIGLVVLAAILPIIVTTVIDLFTSEPVFTTVKFLLQKIIQIIILFLNFPIKVWWILVFIGLLILALYLIVKKGEKKGTDNLKFLNYTTDRLKKWKWSWVWELDSYTKKYKISRLKPHCPECSTVMQMYESYGQIEKYQCPRCTYNADARDWTIGIDKKYEDISQVECLIYDNIEKNCYPETLTSPKD